MPDHQWTKLADFVGRALTLPRGLGNLLTCNRWLFFDLPTIGGCTMNVWIKFILGGLGLVITCLSMGLA